MSKIELGVLHSGGGVMDSSTGHDGLMITWGGFWSFYQREH